MSVGIINWETDFAYPQTGVDLHWWNRLDLQSSDFYVAPHTHNYCEFFIVTKGKLRHLLNGNVSVLEMATVQFVRSNDVHGFCLIPGEESEHVNIGVTEEMLKTLCDVFGADLFDLLMSSTENAFRLSVGDFDFFMHLAQIVTASPVNDVDMYAMSVKNLICNLIIGFCQRHALSTNAQPAWFKDLIYTLHQPSKLNITANEVYEMANYSPAMANKYFKLYTDMTVTEYLRTIKLNYAKNVLEKTNFTTLTIAMQLGFDSLSYFNSMFKRETGKTPHQYRIEARGRIKEINKNN